MSENRPEWRRVKSKCEGASPKMGLFLILTAHRAEQLATAVTTGCWWIRSMDRWGNEKLRRCYARLPLAARSRWCV